MELDKHLQTKEGRLRVGGYLIYAQLEDLNLSGDSVTQNSLWADWMRDRYLKGKSLWDATASILDSKLGSI